MSVTVLDHDQRLLLREALEQSPFVAFFDAHDSAGLCIDAASGEILRVNAAASRLYGWPSTAMTAMLITDLDVGAGDTVRHRTASGEPITVAVTRAESELHERRLHVLTVVRSEQDADRATLRQTPDAPSALSLDAMSLLAAGIAHDFNNVLTVVHGAAGFLREVVPITGDDGATAAEDLASIDRATDRGEALARVLHELARRHRLAVTSVDLNALVEEFAGTLGRTLRGDIGLTFTSDAPSALVKLDRRLVLDGLHVLAANACAAMPEGGTLHVAVSRVSVTPSRPMVEIIIRDSGVGMAEDVRARLFDLTSLVRTTTSSRGTGLLLLHRVMSQLGGTLDCDSAPGGGTTFRLRFPLVVATP